MIHAVRGFGVGGLYFWTIVTNAAVNLCEQGFVWMCFHFFWVIPRTEVPGSHGNTKFLRNFQTLFPKCLQIFHSHQQRLKGAVSQQGLLLLQSHLRGCEATLGGVKPPEAV